MTWRSAIDDCPERDPDHPDYPAGYDEWLEKVMAEPWVRALEDMVKWTGVWVGTEERCFEELRMQVGREVASSPDFPLSAEQLKLYQTIAIDGFFARPLQFLHHRDLSEEDLDDFDAPGWGPEAPILIFRGDAAHRPNYWRAMCKLLARGDALPLAVLNFTGEHRRFRKYRWWTGTTTELLEKLRGYSPDGPHDLPPFYVNRFRPREEHHKPFSFPYDPPDLLYPVSREDYIIFHRQMKRFSPVLEELRIRVSKRKETDWYKSRESGEVEWRSTTYWTIEAPRWKKPDYLGDPNISAVDRRIMVLSWLMPAG